MKDVATRVQAVKEAIRFNVAQRIESGEDAEQCLQEGRRAVMDVMDDLTYFCREFNEDREEGKQAA